MDELSAEELGHFLTSLAEDIRTASSSSLEEKLEAAESVLILMDSGSEEVGLGSRKATTIATNSVNGKVDKAPEWVVQLRIAVRGVLQSRGADASAKTAALRLASSLLLQFRYPFVASDPEFLGLLAELGHVELRLALNDPRSLKAADILPLTSLIEQAVILGSDERIPVPEKVGLVIMGAMREVGSLLVEFTAGDERLDPGIEFPLFRCLCSLLAHDLCILLGESAEKQVSKAARRLVMQGRTAQDADESLAAAELILPGLTHLPFATLADLSTPIADLLTHHLHYLFAQLRRLEREEGDEAGKAQDALGMIAHQILTPSVQVLAKNMDMMLQEAEGVSGRISLACEAGLACLLGPVRGKESAALRSLLCQTRDWDILSSRAGLHLSVLALHLHLKPKADEALEAADQLARLLIGLGREGWLALDEERQEAAAAAVQSASSHLRNLPSAKARLFEAETALTALAMDSDVLDLVHLLSQVVVDLRGEGE